MGNVVDYIKEVMRNLHNMPEDARRREIDNIERMLNEVVKNYEDAHYRQVEKLSRENHQLKVLLGVAADAITELREKPY